MPKITDLEFKEKSKLILSQIQSESPDALQKATALIFQIASDNQHFFDSLLTDIKKAVIAKKHDKNDPSTFATFLDNFIAIILKQKEKLEYHHSLLGFLYNIKDLNKADSIHHYQIAINKNPKFLPTYFYFGLIYLEQNKHEDAVLKLHQAGGIGKALTFASGSFLIDEIINKFQALVQRMKSIDHLNQAILFVNDYRIVLSTQELENGKEKFNNLTNFLSYIHKKRSITQYWVGQNRIAAITDVTLAISIKPLPENYYARYEIYQRENYFYKAIQDLFKYTLPDQNQDSARARQAASVRMKNTNEIHPQLIPLFEKQYKACRATISLFAFITAFNQDVELINLELEKLESKDKMEKLTLLEDLNAAKLAKKSHAEMIRIYNKHVPFINEQLTYFDLPPIENLATPPSLLSLAGLVAAKSDLFRTSKITLPEETIAAVDNDPFIQLMSPKP